MGESSQLGYEAATAPPQKPEPIKSMEGLYPRVPKPSKQHFVTGAVYDRTHRRDLQPGSWKPYNVAPFVGSGLYRFDQNLTCHINNECIPDSIIRGLAELSSNWKYKNYRELKGRIAQFYKWIGQSGGAIAIEQRTYVGSDCPIRKLCEEDIGMFMIHKYYDNPVYF